MKLYNLKEIDLSFNNIKNLEYFENFSTGILESLSLNDNKIEEINALEKMDLKNLKLLNLQNNNIKNVKPLNDVNMPVLELLRIEGNNDLNPAMDEMKKVIKKFGKQIIYVVKNFQDFSTKYNVKIERVKIEALCNLRPNKLRTLYLNNNNISDISPLKRIKFYGDSGKITLENNNFILESSEVQNIIKDLEKKNIKIKVQSN